MIYGPRNAQTHVFIPRKIRDNGTQKPMYYIIRAQKYKNIEWVKDLSESQ